MCDWSYAWFRLVVFTLCLSISLQVSNSSCLSASYTPYIIALSPLTLLSLDISSHIIVAIC